MKQKIKCPECGHTEIKDVHEIKWAAPKFKESMDFHWIDLCGVDGELRFKVFCRKSDCKCFVEDVKANVLIEFFGGKNDATKIIGGILSKEDKCKE